EEKKPEGTITSVDTETGEEALGLRLDEHGPVARMVTTTDVTYEFKYGPNGKVNEVTEPSGTWKTTDGKHWKNEKGETWEGTVNVTSDGKYQSSDLSGNVTVTRNHNGSEVTADKDGHVTKTKDANGAIHEYVWGAGADGKPAIVEFTDPAGHYKTTDGGKTWVNDKNEQWSGTVSLAHDGSFVYSDDKGVHTDRLDGKKLLLHTDGATTVEGKDGHIEKI